MLYSKIKKTGFLVELWPERIAVKYYMAMLRNRTKSFGTSGLYINTFNLKFDLKQIVIVLILVPFEPEKDFLQYIKKLAKIG